MTITTAAVEPLPVGALVARRGFSATITAGTDQALEAAASGQDTRLLQAYVQTASAADVLLLAGTGGSTVLRVPGAQPGVLLPYNPLGWCDFGAGVAPYIDLSAGTIATVFDGVFARLGGTGAFSASAQVIAPTPASAKRHRLEIDEATASATRETILAAVAGKTLRVESGVLTAAAATDITLGATGSGRIFRSSPVPSAGYSRLALPPSPYGWAESDNGGALEILTSAATTVRGHLIVAEIDDAE